MAGQLSVEAVRIPFQIPLPTGHRIDRFVYVYALIGQDVTLVDAGVRGAEARIEAALLRHGRRLDHVRRVILTHSHPDHIGSLKGLQERIGCEVLAHAGEVAWIEDVSLQARQRPVPGFDQLVEGSGKVTRQVQDGEHLSLSGTEAVVFHTPGHSAGSISLLLPESGSLLAGDLIPQAGEMPIYEDVPAMVRSIRRLLLLPGIRTLYSSWAEPRLGADCLAPLRQGLEYVQRLHQAVQRAAQGDRRVPPLDLCRAVVGDLGLPPFAVNPLVARSLAAHLPLLEHVDIREI